MRLIVPVLTLVALASCVSVPPPHQRALENNEYCAQYLAQGDLDKAERHCDLGLQFSPQYADLWVNKGLIAYKRGQNDIAKDCYRKAIHYNPDQAQAYNNLGVIYREVENKLGQAHDQFQQALKINPDYLEARYNLALTYMRLNKKDLARKEYETLLVVNPNLADPHHDLGVMALEDGDFAEAIAQEQKAVELDPSYANAWLTLGNAYAENGKYSEAKDAFTSCLEADPNNAQCRNNVSIVNRKAKLLDPTLKEVKEAQETENTAPALYNLARTYRDKGLKNEEERAYKKCLKIDAKYPACHYGLYEVFSEERRDKEATIACKNFLKFAGAEEFPSQIDTCEKYLSASN